MSDEEYLDSLHGRIIEFIEDFGEIKKGSLGCVTADLPYDGVLAVWLQHPLPGTTAQWITFKDDDRDLVMNVLEDRGEDEGWTAMQKKFYWKEK